QSAKSLRGDKMEDVIFNGSDARKPMGAAEVRLRLSDVPIRSLDEAPDPVDVAEPAETDGEPVLAGAMAGTAEAGGGVAAALLASGNGHKVDLLGAVRDVEVT